MCARMVDRIRKDCEENCDWCDSVDYDLVVRVDGSVDLLAILRASRTA